jgi:hypothetical protein
VFAVFHSHHLELPHLQLAIAVLKLFEINRGVANGTSGNLSTFTANGPHEALGRKNKPVPGILNAANYG